MVLAQRTALIDRIVDGRYRVVCHIADGGMGSVYAAVDLRLDRDVALKVMREDLARDPDFVERFRKEARSAARLSDPHVVAVHDQGEDDGLVFLTMELIDGPTLRARMREAGPLTPREALATIGDVLAALAVAHRAGIVHRDVKPENVLISPTGVVKVADFGLARAVTSTTATALSGTVMGTVAYLAPEQVERGIADARSDVYAAGLMLHEMLTGRPAIEGSSPIHVAYQHVHGTLPKPSDQVPALPAELDELVWSATRRDPDARPADAAVWAAQVLACRDALTPKQLDTRPDTTATLGSQIPAGTTPGAAPAGTPVADPTRDTTAHARSTRMLEVRDSRARGVRTDMSPAGAQPSSGSSGPGGSTGPLGSARFNRSADRPQPGATASPERTASQRPSRRHLIYIAAPLVLILGLLGWYFGIGPGSQRPVPQVAGEEQLVAIGDLGKASLRTAVTEQFSETVAKGSVIASQPSEGSDAARWSTVTLAVSKGPERYAVPALTGQSDSAATNALRQAKLDIGATGRAYSETVPTDQVIATDPKAGTALKPGMKVDLTLSRGRQPLPLALWVGKPLDDASEALTKLGLKVAVSDQEFDSKIPEGSILSQQPAPRTLHRGDAVSFVVSKGPDLVAVPNVRGKAEAEASALLRESGFGVKVSRIAGGLFGTAHSTVPGSGMKAPRGSTITLRIV